MTAATCPSCGAPVLHAKLADGTRITLDSSSPVYMSEVDPDATGADRVFWCRVEPRVARVAHVIVCGGKQP